MGKVNKAQYINQDSGDFEYYSPIKFIEASREVMGSIDLDPASSEIANTRVMADEYYNLRMRFFQDKKEGLRNLADINGGLDRDWYGNVWMNHPFSRTEAPCKDNCEKQICQKRGYHTSIPIPGNKEWIERFVDEYENGNVNQACCITYSNTSETWFKPLLNYLQCFVYGRVNYYLPDGTIKQGVTKGSVVTYLGNNTEKFKQAFSKFGKVK